MVNKPPLETVKKAVPIESAKKSLIQTHPELAKEADGWDPSIASMGSQSKVGWTCARGHKWDATIKSRVQGRGCAVCHNKKVLTGFNDLETTHPEIAKQADGWDPTLYTAGSAKKMPWVCSKGHKWSAYITDRRETGCAVCSGRKVLAGLNDLATTHPKIAQEADGWDPSTIREKSGVLQMWRCELGHTWKASTAMRTKGTKCPYCDGAKVWPGFNDLASTHPQLALQAVGWDTSKYSAGSGKKLKWRCSNHHEWETRIISRVHGSGCPTCSPTQYDPNEKGWLYFLRHDAWGLLQIGITNQPVKRLAKHAKLGWEVIEVRGPMDGGITRDWETSILDYLRKHGAALGVESIQGKFDGYSEAWLETTYPVTSIKELMDLTESSESNS